MCDTMAILSDLIKTSIFSFLFTEHKRLPTVLVCWYGVSALPGPNILLLPLLGERLPSQCWRRLSLSHNVWRVMTWSSHSIDSSSSSTITGPPLPLVITWLFRRNQNQPASCVSELVSFCNEVVLGRLLEWLLIACQSIGLIVWLRLLPWLALGLPLILSGLPSLWEAVTLCALSLWGIPDTPLPVQALVEIWGNLPKSQCFQYVQGC